VDRQDKRLTRQEESVEWIKAAYGPNYERLVALKNTYDPTKLFRHNQNIKPNRDEELGRQ
jgi:hypothetical protein